MALSVPINKVLVYILNILDNTHMKVFVFGNPEVKTDKQALSVARTLQKEFSTIQFIYIEPNEDLPQPEGPLIILDVVEGIDDVTEFSIDDLDNIVLSPRSTVHDYDLNFQLRYLRKLGKLTNVKIIGLPMAKDFSYLREQTSYLRIQEIFKKLVAQDIQGS